MCTVVWTSLSPRSHPLFFCLSRSLNYLGYSEKREKGSKFYFINDLNLIIIKYIFGFSFSHGYKVKY